jgi:hypothetical protein
MGTRSVVAVAFGGLLLTLVLTPMAPNGADAAQQSGTTPGTAQSRPPQMHEMMKMHEQMMAEMKAADAKLEALVKDMNAATGEAKVTALAVLVTELVEQHKMLHSRMGQMHQHMMAGRGPMMRR